MKTTLLNTGHSCQQAVYVNVNGVFDPNDKTKMIQCANNIRNVEMWQLVFGQRKSKKLTNTLLLEMKSDSEIKNIKPTEESKKHLHKDILTILNNKKYSRNKKLNEIFNMTINKTGKQPYEIYNEVFMKSTYHLPYKEVKRIYRKQFNEKTISIACRHNKFNELVEIINILYY